MDKRTQKVGGNSWDFKECQGILVDKSTRENAYVIVILKMNEDHPWSKEEGGGL